MKKSIVTKQSVNLVCGWIRVLCHHCARQEQSMAVAPVLEYFASVYFLASYSQQLFLNTVKVRGSNLVRVFGVILSQHNTCDILSILWKKRFYPLASSHQRQWCCWIFQGSCWLNKGQRSKLMSLGSQYVHNVFIYSWVLFCPVAVLRAWRTVYRTCLGTCWRHSQI